jgi:hypothetical protein
MGVKLGLSSRGNNRLRISKICGFHTLRIKIAVAWVMTRCSHVIVLTPNVEAAGFFEPLVTTVVKKLEAGEKYTTWISSNL